MFFISRKVVQISSGLRSSSLYTVENLLNRENISTTIAKLKGMKPIRLQTQQPVKRAAVLIPICVVNDKVSLLYVVKPSILTEHKEKVNFPGDMQNPEDKSIVDTALRATNNLLGLKPKDIKIWGTGNLIVARSDYSFMPVIGEILGKFNIENLNWNGQIDEVFTVSIQDLCNSKATAHTQFKDEYSTPVFMGSKWRIWGLTAMLTNMVLKSLLPPQGYSHKMKYIPSVKKGTAYNKAARKHTK